MKNGSFGLSESRDYGIRVQTRCGIHCGREMALCPGVFGFFVDAQERPQALLAVHMDDVKLIVDPKAQDDIKGRLNSLFDFGEWQRPEQWTKFCRRNAVA